MRKVAALLLLLAGCSKETSSSAPASPAAPSDPDLIRHEVPSVWTKEEPANKLRKAQYRIPDKEKTAKDALLVLSHFGDRPADVQDNVARWAAQVDGSDPKTETLQGKCKVTLVDLSGTFAGDAGGDPIENARMLAAIVETSEGPWYFKLVGPSDTVTDWREEFTSVLKSAVK